jgi:hypothetical protein
MALRPFVQLIKIIGIKTRKIVKTIGNITNWFSLLIKNFGSPIPTWNDASPSGFPNLRQFCFFYSSVKHSYAFETMMNFACASGLLGLRSGCN